MRLMCSCVYSVYAAETYETFHRESGMGTKLVIFSLICVQIGPIRCPRSGAEVLCQQAAVVHRAHGERLRPVDQLGALTLRYYCC